MSISCIWRRDNSWCCAFLTATMYGHSLHPILPRSYHILPPHIVCIVVYTMYIIVYIPIHSQLLIVVLLNNITILQCWTGVSVTYVFVGGRLLPIYPHPLPIHPPHIDVGDHWCTRLVIYWWHHQLPFVPIDIRWYGWRWYVNTNDEWTVTLMSRCFSTMMVHHMRCNIQAPPIRTKNIHAQPWWQRW